MSQTTIRVADHYSAAEWVRAQNGSCTSPMAVELRMEDAWRVKTTTGAAVVRIGDYLVASPEGIEHTPRCGTKGCDRPGPVRVAMPESWIPSCSQHAEEHAAEVASW